ncbi:MAG: hypothetical protein HC822_05095, partial [Oscillochloris sp.]|nr:hypothetical protein [Oscillochloris sp.]
MRVEIEQLLDQALARLKAGASIEECLREFPEHAAELEPLLRTAELVRAQAMAALPPSMEEWLAQGQREITAVAERVYGRPPSLWQRLLDQLSRWLGVSQFAPRMAAGTVGLLLAVIVMITSLQVTAAASLPGEMLYGWKLRSEQIGLSLSLSPEARFEQLVEMMSNRISEIATLTALDAPASNLMVSLDQLLEQSRLAAATLPVLNQPEAVQGVEQMQRLLLRAENELAQAEQVDPQLEAGRAELTAIRAALPAAEPVDPLVLQPTFTPTATPSATPTVPAEPSVTAARTVTAVAEVSTAASVSTPTTLVPGLPPTRTPTLSVTPQTSRPTTPTATAAAPDSATRVATAPPAPTLRATRTPA